jgi:hypothetical protein
MASDFNRLAKDMAGVAKRVEAGGNKVVRKASLQILSNVTLATPVDTGRARANWITSINSRSQLQRPTIISAGASVSEGASLIRATVAGSVVYIQNNLPYINRLNNGWSQRAPAGFVERAIRNALSALTKAGILS